MKKIITFVLVVVLISACSTSKSKKVETNEEMAMAKMDTDKSDGEKLLKTYCLSCHSDEPAYGNHEGLTAPPFPGIVRRYKQAYPKKDDFIAAIVDYVKKPDSTKALMNGAIDQFGMMPPFPLPDDTLKVIAETLYDKYGNMQPRGRGRGHGRGMGMGRGRGMGMH